jgi:hypothetical protein
LATSWWAVAAPAVAVCVDCWVDIGHVARAQFAFEGEQDVSTSGVPWCVCVRVCIRDCTEEHMEQIRENYERANATESDEE